MLQSRNKLRHRILEITRMALLVCFMWYPTCFLHVSEILILRVLQGLRSLAEWCDRAAPHPPGCPSILHGTPRVSTDRPDDI